MEITLLDTHQKALSINLDASKYGTIAETGAGQETARWFFQVGGATGTIAKAVSAYDMKFSDSIYGACGRYVSRERLKSMLDTNTLGLSRGWVRRGETIARSLRLPTPLRLTASRKRKMATTG